MLYAKNYLGDGPAWSKSFDKNKLTPSKELIARYKQDCPNNWRYLVAAFGQTRTKYDAPL